MNLPSVKFNIQNGGLLQQPATSDKVIGLIATGEAVTGTPGLTLDTSYQLFSLSDAENIGIVAGGANDFIYKQLEQFYTEAGQGAELWLMLVAADIAYTEMLDVTKTYAKKLLADAAGAIRVLGALKKSAGTEVAVDGLDGDVHTAVVKAQALATYYAEKYMPVRVIISGNNYSGTIADLKDYTTASFNKVACLLANTDATKVASVGLALGRLAKTPVQRNLGRVADGAVESLTAYFTNGEKVESQQDAWDAIYNKGYIFLRSFVSKSGYYFSDDLTLTSETDDFNSLARGLVLDKAIILAYASLVNNLLDEVEVAASGTIHPAVVKSWQSQVENALTTMVAAGNLSNVEVYIDENQNILSTGIMQVAIKLQPVGYAKQITVNIGFTTTINN
ncbi:hypothetical protein G7074_15725 [Pedobacter sp. HDW13]|uniref:DUF2586 family protein n=1 Tax=unclassified Pedobacter TaxID=2628915 RepID=UPI000F5A9F03|nr:MULTISPECIES: DUF2586 family protein [unclassified Pedobacter]QIL40587.1 hypothetical protein G7074_15725 [Pedobacter sp. HDW13]RQO66857.1 hypothetical protein DBR40_21635 [Pedobacter sp. KBW01]